MSDEVLAVSSWPSNAAMLADVRLLGYLDGTVLDVTYGANGGFWRYFTPELLVASDLYVRGLDAQFDYRRMLWTDQRALPDRWCDVVVLDAPYRLSGRRDQGEKDIRYGTTERRSRDEILNELRTGAVECYRVCGRFLLVKCQDQVEGGRIRWQTDLITRAVEEAGGRKIDRFDLVTTLRPQPAGRVQRTARRNCSQLLVFEKPAR